MSVTFIIPSVSFPAAKRPCVVCGRDRTAATELADGSCDHCYGMGGDHSSIEQFELNVANGNLPTILERLRIEFDSCGEINPCELLQRLHKYAPPIPRVGTSTKVPGGPTMVDCGQTQDQVERYWERLESIAVHAIKVGSTITWG